MWQCGGKGERLAYERSGSKFRFDPGLLLS